MIAPLIPCPKCGGTTLVPGPIKHGKPTRRVRCKRCHGTGRIENLEKLIGKETTK